MKFFLMRSPKVMRAGMENKKFFLNSLMVNPSALHVSNLFSRIVQKTYCKGLRICCRGMNIFEKCFRY